MNRFLAKINKVRISKGIYLGDEKAARPYGDWYILVVFGFGGLLCLLVVYGYISIRLVNSDPLQKDVLIEKSLSKVKPGELDVLADKITKQETIFVDLLATSTTTIDPSI